MYSSKVSSNEGQTYFLTTQSLIKNLQIPTIVKLILLSIDTNIIPKALQILIYIVSQLQVLSMIAQTALLCMPDGTNYFSQGLQTIHEIFSIGGMLDLAGSGKLSTLMLTVILIIILIVLLTGGYLVLCIQKNYIPFGPIQQLWGFIVCIYAPCLFYPIHYIGVKMLNIVSDNQGWVSELQVPHKLYGILIVIQLIFNFFFAFIFLEKFKMKIKTKSLLATKNNFADFLDVIGKLVFPILWEYAAVSDGLYIPLLYVHLFANLIKGGILMTFLPYYRVIMLRIAVYCHCIIMAAAFSVLLPKIFQHKLTHNNFAFSALVCLMTLLLYTFIIERYFWSVLTSIVSNPRGITNHYHLLHFWDIYKYILSRTRNPMPGVRKISSHFLNYSMAKNVLIMNADEKEEELNSFEVNYEMFEMLQGLLKSSSQKNTTSWLLKAYLARLYLKYKSLYILADDLLNEGLKKTFFINQRASLYYLKLQLLNKLHRRNVRGESEGSMGAEKSKLNVQVYLTLINRVEHLWKLIGNQLQPQMKFWDVFRESEVDTYALMQNAKTVQKQVEMVEKYWSSNYPYFRVSQYTKPSMFYSFYLSFALNDFNAGDKLIHEYCNHELRIQKRHEDHVSEFVAQLFSSESLYFAVSGSPSYLGKVLDCSSNIEKYFGFKKEFMIGKSINMLMPSFFAEKHDKFFQGLYEIIEGKILDQVREIHVLDKQGYLTTSKIYVALRFIPKYGLCYYVLMKPQTSKKENALVSRDGKILNYSKGFGRDMGFKDKTDINASMHSVCPEFEDIMQALTANNNQPYEPSEAIDSPGALPTPPRLTKYGSNFTVVGSQEQLPSSSKTKTTKVFNFRMLRLQTNKDYYYQNLYKRYTGGGNLTFFPINQNATPIPSAKKTRRGITLVYQTTVQTFIYDGNVVFKVSLFRLDELIDPAEQFQMTTVDTPFNFHTPLSQKFVKNNFKGVKKSVTILSPQSIGKESGTPKSAKFKKSNFHTWKGEVPEELEYLEMTQRDKERNLQGGELTDTERSIGSPFNFGGRSPEGKRGEMESQVRFFSTENEAMLSARNNSERVLLTERTKTKVPDHGGDLIEPSDLDISMEEPLPVGSPMSHGSPGETTGEENQAKRDLIESQSVRSVEFTLARKLNMCQALKSAIRSRRYKTRTKIFTLGFIVAMGLQLGFLIWMSYGAIQASDQASVTTGIIEVLHLRVVWMNIAIQENRLYNAIRGKLLGSLWTYDGMVPVLNTSLNILSTQNIQLMQAVGSLDADLQEVFYAKATPVYDRNSTNGLVLSSYDDTFQVIEKILIRGYRNVYKAAPTTAEANYIDTDSRWIYDNSFDDLSINVDSLIDTMKNKLSSDLSKAHGKMNGLLFAILAVILILAVSTLFFVRKINQEVKRFLIKIFTSQINEVNKTVHLLSTFQKMLKREEEGYDIFSADPMENYLSLRDQQGRDPPLETNQKLNRRIASKSSLNRIQLLNYLYLISLYMVLIIVGICVYFYYAKALDNIFVIDKQQTAISIALDNMKKHSMISAQMMALVMENATTTIAHVPILEVLPKRIEQLNSAADLYSAFVDDQTISSKIYDILFNMSCNATYSPDYILPQDRAYQICLSVSSNTGYLGLIKTVSTTDTNLHQFFAQFSSSSRNVTNLKTLFSRVANTQLKPVDMSMTFSLLLLNQTLIDFETLQEDFRNERSTLSWVAILISLLSLTIAWFFIIQKLAKKEFDQREVLNIFSIKLLNENKLLKRDVLCLAK